MAALLNMSGSEWLRPYLRQWKEKAPGAAATLAIHLIAFLAFFYFVGGPRQLEQAASDIVTVSLAPLSSSKFSPQRGSALSHLKARQTPKPNLAGAVNRAQPVDEFQAYLNSLSKLTQPQSGSLATVSGSGEDDASAGARLYGTKDLIRAHVLRRWNLNLDVLGTRNFSIAISVLVGRDGKVLQADIVDKQRFATDPVFRYVAVSARNAVLLSSPLPFSATAETTQITLNLNPRDTQR